MLGVLLGNAGVIVWLWYHGGNVTHVKTTGDLFTSIARITGLLGAYLALVQVVLLARLPCSNGSSGFDRLTMWHRWNGHACLDLILLHVLFSVWGYAAAGPRLGAEGDLDAARRRDLPGHDHRDVGTALLIAVVATSVVIVRRRLPTRSGTPCTSPPTPASRSVVPPDPDGQRARAQPRRRRLLARPLPRDARVLIVFRVLAPLRDALRYRLRVAEVMYEGLGVVSLQITGRQLDRLHARPGQFFLWRFLDRRQWWTAHPFSLSAAPDGSSLRITVKALGDHSSRWRDLRPGTRVVAEGPFGVFTEPTVAAATSLLIAGGIGITPIRALLETMRGDLVVLYRVIDESDVIFRDELERLASDRVVLHVIAGDHQTEDGRELLVARAPPATRPRHRRARGLSLRATGYGRRAQPKHPRRAGSAPPVHTERFASDLNPTREDQRYAHIDRRRSHGAALSLPQHGALASARSHEGHPAKEGRDRYEVVHRLPR